MNKDHTLDAVFRCPHDVAVINVATSKTCVCQGQSTEITCVISNVSEYDETFGISIYATLTKNQDQFSLFNCRLTLLTGGNLLVPWTWHTPSYFLGNYTLTCTVGPAGNETITDDNTLSSSIIVTIPGDIDGDFRVGLSDLTAIATRWHSTPSSANWNPNYDIDGNLDVGLTENVLIADNWGRVRIPDP
jgi:hypothetical protein